jgi:acetolactate synthase-1/2/3 large subunit
MIGVSRPIVKHSFLVQKSEDIPSTIKKAFFIASTGRPGPVVVDIPKDLTHPEHKFEYEYPETVSMRSYQPSAKGHSGQIRKAARMLLSAKRPVIYAGGGVIQGEGSEQLTALARRLKLPRDQYAHGPGCVSRYRSTVPRHAGYAWLLRGQYGDAPFGCHPCGGRAF